MTHGNWPPTTMATQHPDNASAPWWKEDGDPFVSTSDEIQELITLFSQLPIDEYMWDWEGKYVDESVGEKIYARAFDLFKEKPLGQDLHLTYRIPAFDGTKMKRMARAFMNVLSLNDMSSEIGIPGTPVHELFLPLTTEADQLIMVREAFKQIAEYHHHIFHDGDDGHTILLDRFQVTPLIEDIDSMFTIEKILKPYWEQILKEKVDMNNGLRIFLARSDPALNSGLVPAVIAIKTALSKANKLGESLGITVHPIIGTGSLPFRGSVNPLYTDTFLEQYAGVRTYSIQSAFRYDYELPKVEEALIKIKTVAPTLQVQHVSEEDQKKLRKIADIFSEYWKQSIEELAPLINKIADLIPSRRERLLHVGLFGYSRGVGKVTLPRAIKFTAALYSIGIPPELIATGRGIRQIKSEGMMNVLETYYPALRSDLEHAGKYLNRENIEVAAKSESVFKEISDDIKAIDDYLGGSLAPKKPHHMIHRNLTSTIFHRLQEDHLDKEALTHDIVEAALIRRSLG
ncbi:phosphoenolpyruvate carboxylase [Patescibacteria group bacterium]|nr:phosphoenolpyruvate carboxylase [Patescibacteria group bacterium]